MGHFIFVIFHFAAILFGFWALILTIPLHMLYSSARKRTQLLEVIAEQNAPEAMKKRRDASQSSEVVVGLIIIVVLLILAASMSSH